MRVVSLVPSVTETLLAWGVAVAAGTRFCEQPGLLTVGGTKNPDLEAIESLRPDLVIVDEEENRRPDAEALAAAGLAVHVTAVRSLATLVEAMTALGITVGRAREGADLARRIEAIDGARPPLRCRAFVPIWRRPWMTFNADTYGNDLLATCGIANVCAGAGERYPTVDLAEVAAFGADVVLLPSEPYEFTAAHVPELATVAAARLIDGKDLFWWGARTPDAVTRLRAALA